MSVHVAQTTCPWCGLAHPAASNMAGDRQPQPGSAALCFDCGRWSVFTNALELRRPTKAEIRQFTADPDMRRAHTAWFYATRKETHP